jgi:hypothetical protein
MLSLIGLTSTRTCRSADVGGTVRGQAGRHGISINSVRCGVLGARRRRVSRRAPGGAGRLGPAVQLGAPQHQRPRQRDLRFLGRRRPAVRMLAAARLDERSPGGIRPAADGRRAATAAVLAEPYRAGPAARGNGGLGAGWARAGRRAAGGASARRGPDLFAGNIGLLVAGRSGWPAPLRRFATVAGALGLAAAAVDPKPVSSSPCRWSLVPRRSG